MHYQHVVFRTMLLMLIGVLGGCIEGGHDAPPSEPQYDFSAVDTRFQQFLDESVQYDGASYILVDKEQGVVHERAMGDHVLDIVVLLAGVSKVPAASLLMALNDDESLIFDVEATIDNYLTWTGVYGDRTSAQLLSNTSGIPVPSIPAEYGLHSCMFDSTDTLERCASVIYANQLAGTVPPGTRFEYGGSQWHLVGALAEQLTNSSWRQAFDQYIAGPCRMEVMQFGNIVGGNDWNGWSGSPDSLKGLDNPLIYGGAISNLQDMAKLLLLHLRDGKCGESHVLSEASVAAMRVDRTGTLMAPQDWGYGLGWCITQTPTYLEIGAFGSVIWLDIERGIGGFMAIDDYPADPLPVAAPVTWLAEIIPLHMNAVDAARAAVGDTGADPGLEERKSLDSLCFKGKLLYVQAGVDPTASDGSHGRPYSNLLDVQMSSNAGDTIVVLPSSLALDGGIVLKKGQTLMGAGNVSCENIKDFECQVMGEKSTITNTTVSDIFDLKSGAGVVLANGTIVRGLHIVGTQGPAIFGPDIKDVKIMANVIEGANLGSKNRSGRFKATGSIVFDNLSPGGNNKLSVTNTIIRSIDMGQPAEIHGIGPGVNLLAHNAQVTLKLDRLLVQGVRSPVTNSQTAPALLLFADGDASVHVDIQRVATNLGSNNDGVNFFPEGRAEMSVAMDRFYVEGSTFPGDTRPFLENGIEAISHLQAFLTSTPLPADHPKFRLSVQNSRMSNGEYGAWFVLHNTDTIDFGGGAMGSSGHNEFLNNAVIGNLPRGVALKSYEPGMVGYAVDNSWGPGAVVRGPDGPMLNPEFAEHCTFSPVTGSNCPDSSISWLTDLASE